MKDRLLLLSKYFIYWFVYFLVAKSLFLICNFSISSNLTILDVVNVYLYGLKLDLSATSYIVWLPLLLSIVTIFVKYKWYRVWMDVFTFLLLFVFCFLIFADISTYQYWGRRLDTSALLYITTPQSAIASIEFSPFIVQIILFLALFLVSVLVYYRLIRKSIDKLKTGKWYEIPVILFLFAALIIPIRGGFGMPLNTGSAYFSEKQFANHASINLVWHIGYSITELETIENPYKSIDQHQADAIVQALYPPDNQKTIELLKTKRPNVILLIVESFTAKLIEPLGGTSGVTPRFNALIHEGVLFNQLYASGTRSDKGLVAVVSGFPALPNTAIIRFPDKTMALPSIAKDLKKEGYSSSYYYGGDIDFASMRSYVVNAGYDKITSQTDFPNEKYARWGVHDHLMFNKLYSDIDTCKRPFFYTLFTLSSHEPFDVPMKPVFEGTDDNHLFMNSIYYTDSCIGDFVARAKKAKWWDNTLIIITADHSTINDKNNANYEPSRFHIPMLWLGGALKVKDTVITHLCSQTDIPFTVLRQMEIEPQKQYKYSHNILLEKYCSYAFCVYNNGYGAFTDSAKVSYDYDEAKIKFSEHVKTDSLLHTGRAYMQTLYSDFMYIK